MTAPSPRPPGAWLRDARAPCSGAVAAGARRAGSSAFGNRHRVRYPQFRASGLSVSSGVVEAGCKQIGARLKRAGMRWTVDGANAIIALRCSRLSARFEDFWERRAANAA